MPKKKHVLNTIKYDLYLIFNSIILILGSSKMTFKIFIGILFGFTFFHTIDKNFNYVFTM